jgi:glyoxylate/hydroxypyruvate reductase A
MTPVVPFVRRVDQGPHPELLAALRSHLDDIDVVPLDEIVVSRLDEVTVAIVDGPSADQLAALPNLALVQSTWAGVEEIVPAVPIGVAIARMLDPQLAATMAEAVLAWTLYLHRDMPVYARQERIAQWKEHPPVKAVDRRVGVVGLGALGAVAARTLAGHGFTVAGWSRSPKVIDGVECLDGAAGLRRLLERSDIVVNLLPHTGATTGILDAEAFAVMRPGSSLINFGRGPTVDDRALLDALDRGHVGHAVLDVFTVEPLPADHRYWAHESVTVLPHISGPTSVDTAAVIAADNVRRFLESGELPTAALVDRSRGY